MPADREKVLTALASAGAVGLRQTQIYSEVFAYHRGSEEIRRMLDELTAEGLVESALERSHGDRPALRWRKKANMRKYARSYKPRER